MATTISARQYPLVALVDLGIANIGAGNEVAVPVRPGTLVTGISARVVTAFDSGTTATVSASDGTTTFISAENAKAAAGTAVAVDVTGKYFPSGGTITFSLAETGTVATVGQIMAAVEYVIAGRQQENQF